MTSADEAIEPNAGARPTILLLSVLLLLQLAILSFLTVAESNSESKYKPAEPSAAPEASSQAGASQPAPTASSDWAGKGSSK